MYSVASSSGGYSSYVKCICLGCECARVFTRVGWGGALGVGRKEMKRVNGCRASARSGLLRSSVVRRDVL